VGHMPEITIAIVFKTQCNMILSNNSQKGFTYVELIVVVVILISVLPLLVF